MSQSAVSGQNMVYVVATLSYTSIGVSDVTRHGQLSFVVNKTAYTRDHAPSQTVPVLGTISGDIDRYCNLCRRPWR